MALSWGEVEKLSDRELLNLRFKDLPLDLKGTALEALVIQAKEELRQKSLRIRPSFWISTDWFVIEGGTGVALPFYLLHPRLTELEKSQVGFAEGAGKQAMLLLRHELGHVIDHAYRLAGDENRQQIFGPSSLPYRSSYEPLPYSRRFVRHLPGQYAQSHPDEDFAETFAVWLTPKSQWRKKYQDWPVALAKLKYIDKTMKRISGARPGVQNLREFESVAGSNVTLAHHYQRRRRHYRTGRGRQMDHLLLNRFSMQEGRLAVHRFLRENRRELVRDVAQKSGLYQYKVNQVVQEMINRCQQLNLQMSSSEKTLSSKLKAVLVLESQRFEKSGLYREMR